MWRKHRRGIAPIIWTAAPRRPLLQHLASECLWWRWRHHWGNDQMEGQNCHRIRSERHHGYCHFCRVNCVGGGLLASSKNSLEVRFSFKMQDLLRPILASPVRWNGHFGNTLPTQKLRSEKEIWWSRIIPSGFCPLTNCIKSLFFFRSGGSITEHPLKGNNSEFTHQFCSQKNAVTYRTSSK